MKNISLSLQVWLWGMQRLSAAVLAICVALHLVVMIYAVRGGLSGAEILSRTQGNWGFLAFYTAFALACAVHTPIGLMRIAQEWLGWSAVRSLYVALVIAAGLGLVGLRAALVVFV